MMSLRNGLIEREVRSAEAGLSRIAALSAHRRDFEGLKVTCRANWDYPPHEAIIRAAVASRADLIVASVQPNLVGGRLLLANTDWELIRHSPVALLLIKSSRGWRKPAVLAAIDPFHKHEKPAGLDQRILKAGDYMARELGGALHVFHACMPLAIIAPAPAGAAMAVTLPLEADDVHRQQVRQGFDKVIARFAVPPSRRHLEMGVTKDELLRVTRQLKAGVAVLGAVSRSAWRRFIIGSTAEDVLDRLPCDVLIVKPRDFRTRVPRRTYPG